ncbi:MAG: transporter substrate-binding domain-containing protein [Peptoniphilus sp.]|nr:transporter substrate-binding domain-containing protein [Peptoniphilus sp.]MDD7362774.1 transporter substrate-binding domain-containing protein [Bacillota bacterium]MDY6044034.1 transporter substrate-binding domain-containing protein [Peptoniphilus sp.]
MKKTSKIVLLLTVAALVLTGCGAKNSKGSNQAAASDRAQSEGKVLRVGVAAQHKPWCYQEGDEIKGIDIDILNEVCKRMGGYKLELQLASFEGMFGLLDTDKVDTVAQQITVNPEREKKYVFSDIYAYNPYKLTVREDENDINSIEDLKGKSFVCGPAGAEYDYIQAYKKENDPNDEIKVVVVEEGGSDLVNAGKGDAFLYPVSAFDMMKEESGKKVKMVGDTVYEEHNAYPFRKDVDPELLESFNKALDSMKEDGTLTKMYVDIFGYDLSNEGVEIK